MSQLSSTLKRYTESSRYTDAPYAKPGYGTYTPSSYGANLAASFLEKEKLGFKPVSPTSFLPRPRTYGPSSILDCDRGRPLLRSDIIGSSKRSESWVGLTGPVCYAAAGCPCVDRPGPRLSALMRPTPHHHVSGTCRWTLASPPGTPASCLGPRAPR